MENITFARVWKLGNPLASGGFGRIPAELEKELLDEYGNFAANAAGHAFEYTEQDIYEQLRKKLRPYEKNQ
jgi:hypothetical protein